MYNKLIGARNDVLKSGAFIASICIPIALSVGVALLIHYLPSFNSLLSHLWETMKLPIAIASLSIPLATWAIANHGSARVTETLKIQDRKQLSELYFEQEKLFEKVLARKIEHYEFKYITIKDLPVIHATIFDYKNLHKNGHIIVRNTVSDNIKKVIEANNIVSYAFYDDFIAEKNGNNDSIKMHDLTAHYISTIQHNLMILTPYIGCRVLREGVTSLGLLVSAYVEIEHMMLEIRQYIFDGLPENYISEADYELYHAILNVTTEYFKCGQDDLTIAKISDTTRTNVTIKHFVKSDLHRFIFGVMDKIRPLINDACSHLIIQQEDLEYISIKVFHNNPNNYLRVFFTKDDIDSIRAGKLKVEWNDESHSVDVIYKEDGYIVGNDNTEQHNFINSILVLSRSLYFMDTSTHVTN
ncbi:hypothetical protein [Aeromonas veronii]|uniref:hypothetical protein n=1 Tax=Aeromonas veronii TaxID=654 RepID=UPI001115B2DD|nr:hypothetical protein [Aeromonas veronii]